MKARLLKSILNDTGYIISNNDGYVAVGSPMCHNLIEVDKETLKMSYALGNGRKDIKSKEMEEIWDKLAILIETGTIRDIIDGRDVIDNPLPVFAVKNGILIESVTDKYGWPNCDDNGDTMYDNTHFPTKKQAIEEGIEDCTYNIEAYQARIKDQQSRIKELKAKVQHLRVCVAVLKAEI